MESQGCEDGRLYFREKGQLCCPPGQVIEQTGKPKAKKIIKLATVTCQVEHAGIFRVLTLKSICVQFVASNVELADSLEGFPDIIGKEIFDACVSKGKFLKPDESCANYVSLFSDAYLGEFLSEVDCFRKKHVRLEEALPCLLQFKHLEKLDLFGCSLGDNHDILTWISTTESITDLGLGRNCLSNEGVRKMTAPMRMYNNLGPKGLTTLDLSYNEKLTVVGVQYSRCFKKLSAINLTGCLRIERSDEKLIKDKLTLKKSSKPLLSFSKMCHTKGWASEVVSNWASESKRVSISVKDQQSQSKAKKFYSSNKKAMNTSHLKGVPPLTPAPALHFIRDISNAECKSVDSRRLKEERKPQGRVLSQLDGATKVTTERMTVLGGAMSAAGPSKKTKQSEGMKKVAINEVLKGYLQTEQNSSSRNAGGKSFLNAMDW